MPSLLLPRKGRYGLIDYEKMFCADLKSGQDVFAMRGIDRDNGCIVVVRPDQYVGHVLPLDAYAELCSYFDGISASIGPEGRESDRVCREGTGADVAGQWLGE